MRKTLKYIFNIILFFFFFSTVALATTRYVNTACDNGDTDYDATTQTCNAGSDTVYNSINNAISAASATETVSLADGTYTTGQIVLPDGISLTSTSADNTLVTISPSSNLDVYTPLISIVTATPGGDANLTISHITLDGDDGSHTAVKAISVKNKDNVIVHDMVIKDFNSAANALAIEAIGTEAEAYGDVYAYFTTDNAKSSLWNSLTNPVQGFQFYNNHVINCGYNDGVYGDSPVKWLHLKNPSVHDNIVDTSAIICKPISRTPAIIEGMEFYNNRLIAHSDGILPTGKTMWSVELWGLYNCSVYNNTGINGGFSLTVGNLNEVYKNFVDKSLATSGKSYSFELTFNNNLKASFNYWKANNQTLSDGMVIGAYNGNSPDNSTFKYWVWGNISEDIGYNGIFVNLGSNSDGASIIAYIFNDLIYHTSGNGTPSGLRFEQDEGTNATATIVLRNVQFINNGGYGWRTKTAAPDSLTTSNNQWWGNTANSTPSSIASNDIGSYNGINTEPSFYGSSFAAENGDASQVDAGYSTSLDSVDGVDMSYGLHSSTNWTGGTNAIGGTIPDVVVVARTTADIGPYEFIGTSSAAGTLTSGYQGGNITEEHIVAGSVGGEDVTIIINLSGTTWDATLGGSNAVSTAFIQGFDSAQSETHGWNNEVRDVIDYTAISRDSDTQATLTVPATAAYEITANENITMTIAAACTAYGSEITASGTLTISNVSPAVSGVGLSYGANGRNYTQGANGINITIGQ